MQPIMLAACAAGRPHSWPPALLVQTMYDLNLDLNYTPVPGHDVPGGAGGARGRRAHPEGRWREDRNVRALLHGAACYKLLCARSPAQAYKARGFRRA